MSYIKPDYKENGSSHLNCKGTIVTIPDGFVDDLIKKGKFIFAEEIGEITKSDFDSLLKHGTNGI